MGLDISDYSYNYAALHHLRQAALDIEGRGRKLRCEDYGKEDHCGKCAYCKLDHAKTVAEQKKVTRFYEFINHSDCDGGYLSFSRFGVTKKRDSEWGDLDELKKEVKKINKKIKVSSGWQEVWNSFNDDVENAGDILRFH